jgi:hypothetical protein
MRVCACEMLRCQRDDVQAHARACMYAVYVLHGYVMHTCICMYVLHTYTYSHMCAGTGWGCVCRSYPTFTFQRLSASPSSCSSRCEFFSEKITHSSISPPQLFVSLIFRSLLLCYSLTRISAGSVVKCMHACMDVCMYACMYVCINVR